MGTQADFPAAHSMDTVWFAVDEDGHVAVFDSGEGGAIPETGFPREGGGLEEDWLLARALWTRAASDERLMELLPASLAHLEKVLIGSENYFDLRGPLLRSLGVYTYSCEEGVAMAYAREGTVPDPLRLEALDAKTQSALRGARLPVRFQHGPALAPGEHVPVVAWDAYWFDTAGRAHPTADAESAFQQDVERFEALDPRDYLVEAVEGKHFEGEALYDAVERLILGLDPKDRSPKPSWWRRLLGWTS